MPRSDPSPRYVHTLHLQAGRAQSPLEAGEYDLDDRITELEERLRAAPELEGERRAARRDVVPPVDRPLGARRSGNGRRLTKQEQQLLARERRGHILVSLLLVTMLIGLLNWLAHLLRI